MSIKFYDIHIRVTTSTDSLSDIETAAINAMLECPAVASVEDIKVERAIPTVREELEQEQTLTALVKSLKRKQRKS